jgi:prepilin-type N-terminal cleavage/methylation domain-containing protein
MNKMRNAFTMIELVFVIVIIGILASVALPKLTSVSKQAQVAKLIEYAGTLERTVLPRYWSHSMNNGRKGAIAKGGAGVFHYSPDIREDLDAPTGLGKGTSGLVLFTASSLLSATYDFGAHVEPNGNRRIGDFKIDNIVVYKVACTIGSDTTPPRCNVYDVAKSRYLIENYQDKKI